VSENHPREASVSSVSSVDKKMCEGGNAFGFRQKMNNFLVCYIKKTYICSETILEGKPMGSSIEMKQYPVADKVEYIIALVSEFGKAHSLTDSQAWRYIKRYGGVKLMDEHYGFMHTQSFSDMVADMTVYLNRQGGKLV
jgi:hypothetical protein